MMMDHPPLYSKDKLTEDGEDGRVADSLPRHVLRHARVVAHVRQPGLDDEQVALGGDDEVAPFLLGLHGDAVPVPSDLRGRDTLRSQTAELHLPLQLHTPGVGMLREMFPDN